VRLFKTSFACGITVLLATSLQLTAGPSHPEVLVVYNSNSTDSLAVANHYQSQRNIPTSNLCAIAPPATDILSLSDYTTYVRTPIQSCLNTLGTTKILYIVMTYLTPFGVLTGPQGTAAIDSYLADIWNKYASQPFILIPNVTQPYYADSQSQGNYYSPFESFATYRANARNPLIYSVWRLDAPTAAIASALVDQAITAEGSGGPSGQACLDETENPATLSDASYPSGDWDLYRAAQFLRAAQVTVTEDQLATEFGSSPSPLTCPDTAFYSGWYSLYHYNNAFTWQTGSIGWHLDSESALSPRTGPSWVPNALEANLTNGVAGGATPAGIAVTSGSVSEPYLQGLVRPGGTFRNLLEGASVGDAFLRNTRWLKWEIMYVGDPLYKPFGAGLPPFSPLQPVNSFLISPQAIVGGANSTGTLTLSAPAPTGGESFSLAPVSGLSFPATVTVAGGATKASFPITTATVTGEQDNVITASSSSLTLQDTIVTVPLFGTFVPSLTITMAGFPIGVTAILNGPAPVGGATISLSSDNPAITVPPTVTIPAGSMVATFTASSTAVSSTATPHITGTYAGASSTLGITVVPGISSMDASPPTINVGSQVVIEVYLGTYVPAGNTATVHLSSSNPSALALPSTITVPAGGNYGNSGAIAAAGSSGDSVIATAVYGGSTVMVTVNIN
jgi:uncharacterized protein (TIGR03790 family)